MNTTVFVLLCVVGVLSCGSVNAKASKSPFPQHFDEFLEKTNLVLYVTSPYMISVFENEVNARMLGIFKKKGEDQTSYPRFCNAKDMWVQEWQDFYNDRKPEMDKFLHRISEDDRIFYFRYDDDEGKLQCGFVVLNGGSIVAQWNQWYWPDDMYGIPKGLGRGRYPLSIKGDKEQSRNFCAIADNRQGLKRQIIDKYGDNYRLYETSIQDIYDHDSAVIFLYREVLKGLFLTGDIEKEVVSGHETSSLFNGSKDNSNELVFRVEYGDEFHSSENQIYVYEYADGETFDAGILVVRVRDCKILEKQSNDTFISAKGGRYWNKKKKRGQPMNLKGVSQ